MRKLLLAIKSVLDGVKTTTPSPNFDDLHSIVQLGLWEVKLRKSGECPDEGVPGAEMLVVADGATRAVYPPVH